MTIRNSKYNYVLLHIRNATPGDDWEADQGYVLTGVAAAVAVFVVMFAAAYLLN